MTTSPNQSPQRIMVVGANGFIGRHVASGLQQSGREIIAVGRGTGSGSHFVDVTDARAVRALFEDARPDIVLHFAAMAHRKPGDRSVDQYGPVNHLGTKNILDAARATGARKFVFASSASVYGDPRRTDPLDESAPAEPNSAYGRSKKNAELECLEAASAMEVFIFRFSPVYAREWLSNVRNRAYIPGLERRVLLRVLGRQPLYSFCAVEHAVEATRMVIEGTLTPGTYNVADDAPYSQNDVRNILRRLDATSLVLPLPGAAIVTAAHAVGAILPARIRHGILSNINKLLLGLVLDTSKIRGAGFRAPQAMYELSNV